MNKTHTTNNRPILMNEFCLIMFSASDYKMVQTKHNLIYNITFQTFLMRQVNHHKRYVLHHE